MRVSKKTKKKTKIDELDNKKIKKEHKDKKIKDKSKDIKDENIKNTKGNVFLIILSLLLFISSLLLGYVCLKYVDLKKNNNNLQNEINGIKDNILNIDQDYISYNDELDKMKTELKDKIEEYNIWLETIEKVK